MNVLNEILKWSKDRPGWQRDALRRLVTKGDLDDNDIDALTEICKSAYELAAKQESCYLQEKHLPGNDADVTPVKIKTISHKQGVNALAENQTLEFSTGLTVVYGDNASGKSGYIRIFKSGCRARGTEDILGNLLSGEASLSPKVSIEYTVGNGPIQEWTGGKDNESLSRASVFDRHSEAIYTTKKTDVAFRPFGLVLFDKLSMACDLVKKQLEFERSSLGNNAIPILDLPKETAADKLMKSLSPLTSPDEVRTLGRLTEDESNRLVLINKQLRDLQTDDTTTTIQALTLRGTRLKSLSQHLKNIDKTFATQAIETVFEAQSELQRNKEYAKNLRENLFHSNHLAGTGSKDWSDMWEASRRFSENLAFPGKSFPVTDAGSRCVLCQQELTNDTIERMVHFEEFVTTAVEKSVREASDSFEILQSKFRDLIVSDEETKNLLRDLSIDDENLSEKVASALSLTEQHRTSVIESLENGTSPERLADLPSYTKSVEVLANQLIVRAESLRSGSSENQKEDLVAELNELKARQLLGNHEEDVLSEIERLNKLAAYEQCIKETSTRSITSKSTTLTKTVVTQQLKTTFQKELEKLKFGRVEVELQEAGGQSGKFHHKLILTRAPSAELPKVVSEGESRCLSIAAFFAELSTADDCSAILLDDPVSSCDYKIRDSVAERLVAEAKERQVIVFTHDIVFLLRLLELANQEGVKNLTQHIRYFQTGAGVRDDDLPWVAMSVNKRIRSLNRSYQSAEKLFRTGQHTEYEKEASYIYGSLRESWERGLEEVLLNGVIERFRRSVETQRIAKIADITTQDCQAVVDAMTKLSKWLTGHDQAAAAREDIPEPSEVAQDIKALKDWVSGIRERR